MPTGIPTTTPITRPSPSDPTAHPTSAPRTAHAAVKPIRVPPAPARAKFVRPGSTALSVPELVTAKSRFPSGVDSVFVTLPRMVFVHGSVGNAELTFSEQRSLADRFELVVLTRGGYPPRPPVERIDFEDQAEELTGELRAGDHLVGHSYGAVVSLLAAARNPVLTSLTVAEPPAFGVAADDPAVRDFM